jgi:NAD(P)-dependent dehydrogenase (short-subunit alcohol dehydrogenase family)
MRKKTIAISGGLGSIGLALALKFAQNNFNVLVGDNNIKKYKFLKKKLDLNNIKFYKCDLLLGKEVEKFITYGINNFKKIDYTIYCCYPKTKDWNSKFENIKQSSLNKNISDHLGGSIIYSQKFIKYFLKEKGGKLIHISSIQGISAPKFEHYEGLKMNSPIAYSAIKSGIIAITRYLAKLYGKKNIQINCISPGGIKANQSKIFTKRYRKSCLSKGLLDSQDLFPIVSFLFSENSRFINGQNIVIDDGWSL